MSRKARKKNYNKYRNKKGGDYLRVIQGGALQRKRQKEVNIVPRNFHQDDLLGLLEDRNINIVFAVGPAGTGKTLISTLAGIKSLKNNKINKQPQKNNIRNTQINKATTKQTKTNTKH